MLTTIAVEEIVEAVRQSSSAFHRSVPPSAGIRRNFMDGIADTSKPSPTPVLIMSFLKSN